MRRIYLIATFIFMILSIYLSYMLGYYTGVNKSLLFIKLLNANNTIYAIDNIKSNKLDKSIALLASSLEDDIAAINDINSNFNKPQMMLKRYFMYEELLDYNRKELVDKVTNKYNNFLRGNNNPQKIR